MLQNRVHRRSWVGNSMRTRPLTTGRSPHRVSLGGMPSYSLGIDIGGTFTDVVVYDHDTGRQWSRKVLTTHDDPGRAVVEGTAAVLGEARLEPRHFTRVVHATTLFTNALIERKGAVTGLVTTVGFGDTLEIGRERKFELYDLNIAKPEPLVPRHRRLEVDERVRADGR